MESLRECITIGNGPSLRNIPSSFLKSRPTIGVNYFPYYPHYHGGHTLDYWVCWDSNTLEANIPLLDGVHKFIPTRLSTDYRNFGFDTKEVTFWCNYAPMDGMGFDELYGVLYQNSLHAAWHIAEILEFNRILVVGYDCTVGIGEQGVGPDGKSNIPHFYDPDKPYVRARRQDELSGVIHTALKSKGIELINLSVPSMCTTLPREDWRAYA